MCAAWSNGGRVELHKGADPRRDQSYFLYGTTREQLDFLRFPLGDLPKDEVRRIAAELGLEVAAKPDSQDICFVPDGDYAGLVKRLRPETEAPGEIVDLEGRVLGRHAAWSTSPSASAAGSRSAGRREPLYVIRIEPEQARIVVGPRRALAVEAMRVERLNWLGDEQREVSVKVRSLARRCRRDPRGRLAPFRTRPNMAWRRARRRCSTTARGCSAAAGSPKPFRPTEHGGCRRRLAPAFSCSARGTVRPKSC